MKRLSDIVRQRISESLREDVGAGDWTTDWCVPATLRGEAEIIAKRAGVIAGAAAAAEVFSQLGGAEFEPLVDDGADVVSGSAVARVHGRAQAILTAERTALNFLGHLSGIATLTREFVRRIAGTGALITDTRKTTPLWRELERAATRVGGAVNHRRGLDSMVLIKENHIACAGGIAEAVRRAKDSNDRGLRIEVETTSLSEVEAALVVGVDRIMLDNMDLDAIRQAVRLIRAREPRPEIEVSGGVTLDNVRALAEAGVDYVSVGALTHSAPALDLSMRMREVG